MPVQPVQPVQPKLELEEKNQFPMPNSHFVQRMQKRAATLATLDRANIDAHFSRPTSDGKVGRG